VEPAMFSDPLRDGVEEAAVDVETETEVDTSVFVLVDTEVEVTVVVFEPEDAT
jgi:hypothetical protein